MRPPFKHQVVGTEWLLEHPRALLADSMRLGKTRQAIDAAQELFLRGEVDSALVVAPGEVARSVWADPDRGQIAEFTRVPAELTLIRADKTTSWATEGEGRRLSWYVTNYELARRPERLEVLRSLITPRTYLILDEGSAVKSPTSQQTLACYALSRISKRCVILNGTPHGDNPGDLYAPFKILDAAIVGCENWYQYRAKYAKMGGYRRLVKRRDDNGKWVQKREPVQIVGWVNLEDLYARTAPFVLRRTLDDVFDLPPALDPVTIEVPLDPGTWRVYKQMKDHAIADLESGEKVTAVQAGVHAMRLAQITSGFIGGVDGTGETREVGSEKLDAILAWHAARLEEDPRFRVIFWCRFRAEAERLQLTLSERVVTRLLYGGQDADERAEALNLLGPRCNDRAAGTTTWPDGTVTSHAEPLPDRAAALVGIQRTGGMGLDFSGASTTVHVSNEFSLLARQQADARVLGPNQTRPCAYFDFACTGPAGQRTVDHVALKALRGKEDMATWGAARWAQALREE